MIRTKDIRVNPANPRVIKDDRFEKLVQSLKEFPKMLKLRPIIVDGQGVILAGNMRYKALLSLGYKELPDEWVKRADELTDEELRRFIIADNVGFGEHDWQELADNWDLSELESWGLDFPDNWASDNKEITEDEYEVPEEIDTEIKLGDLIEVGQHRLLCGDSTDPEQVAKLMNGEKADMVFTDPPYGVSVVQNRKVGGDKPFRSGSVGGRGIVRAKTYPEIVGDDTTDTARKFYRICADLGFSSFVIWGGNYFTDFLTPSPCWLIWDKENSGNFADVEMAWTSFDRAAKLYRWQWNGMIRKGDKEIEGRTRVHPTQKPVGLFVDIFRDFDFAVCLDGFLGSGSTMVAANQLNRKCYGLEIDPKYCQVIVDRMLKLDPDLEVKLNGEIWLL